ncbi:MAG: hypothetical protein KDD37_11410, partial [Bdellovibrionales bacterium]|nr:hypothetical protein [Bdellovibrionales bacterium]
MAKSEPVKQMFTENLGYKLLALVVTVFLWTFVMGRDDAIESKDMLIDVFLPSSHELYLVQPNRVQVTLKGTPKLLRRYFNNKKTIKYDIYNVDKNNIRIEIKDGKLELPYGLHVVSITPRHVDMRIKPRTGYR